MPFTTDSNGAKTFSSSNTSSATIHSSNGTVTLVRVGNTTMSVSLAETNAVALYCICNRKVNPQCNDDWYNKKLYRDKNNIVLRPTD